MISILKKYNSYQLAVFLSSLSMVFGILRELIIVSLFGFTLTNDILQIYLSIFYTIGLTIDAMRLACLNLFLILPLSRILLSASIISLPFSIGIGIIMSISVGGLDSHILLITILGGYLNLIAALLITYKQRNNVFLAAQVISVLPNFILIPGVIICYWLAKKDAVFIIVTLTSLIPCFQCILLLLLPNHSIEKKKEKKISLWSSLLIFIQHFSAVVGEQLFQIIIRSAFFNYGEGYLSLFAIAIRIYSGLRFILIDSYIGSKLAHWENESQKSDYYLFKMINSIVLSSIMVLISLFISLKISYDLTQLAIQMIILLLFGFYLSTLVRIIYFKINRYQNNTLLIIKFATYELIFACFAFILTKQLNDSLLAILWIGYIAKPFAQLLFLRRHFFTLSINWEYK
jgi:hypothetical protein